MCYVGFLLYFVNMAQRRITQETFDAVVRENIDDFDMEETEALKEAIEQFESQGNSIFIYI